MIIQHDMLVRRLLIREAHPSTMVAGKAAFRQLLCEPRLFDVIFFGADKITIMKRHVIVSGEGSNIYLVFNEPNAWQPTFWDGELQ